MKKQLILFFAFIHTWFSIFSQSGYCIENRFSESHYFDSSAIEFTPGVTYAVAKRWPAATVDSLKLDVFAPALTSDSLAQRPFILLIHGGAFMAGSRNDMHYQCMQYARRGFVAATISYRLGWNCAATDLLGVCVFCQGENFKLKTATYRAAQDARAALRYIHQHAADYGIDTSWMFIGGESAGAITALHTTFWSQAEADSFASWASGDVGLLDTAGNNLPNEYSLKAVIDNCGAVSRDSIVLNHNIPVISFHDEADCVVPNSAGQVISCVCQPFYWAWGSSAIHNIMSNEGTCTEMNLVPLSINHCSYPAWNLVPRASCFLKQIMCGDCVSNHTTDVNLPVHCDTLSATVSSNHAIKIADENRLLFFPNPASGYVTFDISNYLSYAPLHLSITDAQGRIVKEEKNILSPAYTAFIEPNASGIYFIAVSSRQKILARAKLIAQP